MYTLVVPSLSTKFIKNSHQNLPVSQYLGTKLYMLFEIVLILGKQLFYLKILDFMQKHYSVVTFVHINLPKKPIFFHKLV